MSGTSTERAELVAVSPSFLTVDLGVDGASGDVDVIVGEESKEFSYQSPPRKLLVHTCIFGNGPCGLENWCVSRQLTTGTNKRKTIFRNHIFLEIVCKYLAATISQR